MARHRAGAAPPWALAGGILLLPWIFASWRPGNPDISWLMHVAGRLLDGARYGRDVIEINPPLIAWLMLPVAALARVTGLAPMLAWQGTLTLLTAGVVVTTVHLLPGGQAGRRWLAPFLALVLVVVPTSESGQRDHLAVMLVLPYLALLARRLSGETVSRGTAFAVGAAAAVGFLLKPHFLAAFAAVELVGLALRARAAAPIARPERSVVLAAAVAYPAFVLVLAPDYLGVVRDLGPLYQRFLPFSTVETWVGGATRPWVLMLAIAVAVVACRRERAPLEPLLAAAGAGFGAAALVQGKGWLYLWLPAVTLSLLTLYFALARSAPTTSWRRVRLLRAAAMLGFSAWLGGYAVRWAYVTRAARWEARAEESKFNRVRRLVGVHARGQAVAALGPSHAIGFPGVVEGGGRWSFRLGSTWPLAALHPEASGPGPVLTEVDPAAWAFPHGVLRIVAEDLLGDPPRLLFVPVPDPGARNPAGHRRFDYLGLLGSDPAVGALLAEYRCLERVGSFAVLVRGTAPGAGPLAGCGL